MIVEHPNDLVRDQYVMRLADRLDIAPDRLRATVATRAATVRTPSRPDAPRPPAAAVVDRRELDALRWAVQAPELMSGRLDVELFADPIARERVRGAHAVAVARMPRTAHRPRSRRCCSGSRSKSPKTASRPTSVSIRVVVNLVEASSQTVAGVDAERRRPPRFRGQVVARRARERASRRALGCGRERRPSNW